MGARYSRNYRFYGTHELVLRQVPIGTRVLDVGCASGYLGAALVERGCAVVGIDNDEQALQRAAPAYEQVACFDLEMVDDLPWPEASFDVVLAADVLEHLRDPARTLGFLRRYLRPGGRLIVSLPNVAHVTVRLSLLCGRFAYTETGLLDRTHIRFFTFRSALDLVEEAGFTSHRVLGSSNRFGGVLNAHDAVRSLLGGLLAFNIIIVATRP